MYFQWGAQEREIESKRVQGRRCRGGGKGENRKWEKNAKCYFLLFLKVLEYFQNIVNIFSIKVTVFFIFQFQGIALQSERHWYQLWLPCHTIKLDTSYWGLKKKKQCKYEFNNFKVFVKE